MSKIHALLAQHCPDGVQWLEMQEVFHIRNGYTPSKANAQYWKDGTIPWFRMEDIRLNGRILSDSIQHITPQALKGGKLFPANSIIVATTATIGEHALITVESLANQRFTFLSKKQTVEDKLDMKFFFYYMFIVDQWCKTHINASNFASVDMAAFRKLKIPIPPIPVQQEIVRILDAFVKSQTKLEIELQTELELRKKQYRYYRDMLLNFEDNGGGGRSDVEYKMLGEIGIFYGGLNGKSKSDFTDGNAKFITYMNIYNHLATNIHTQDKVKIKPNEKQKSIKLGDVLFTGSSENIQECGMSSVVCEKPNEKIYLNSFCFGYRLNDPSVFIPGFLKYLFRSSTLRDQIKRTASGVTRFNVSKKKMAEVLIPIPPLEEQKRIAGILDKFDQLLSDISVGIPAEIKMRRKQYEYYRDKLLEF